MPQPPLVDAVNGNRRRCMQHQAKPPQVRTIIPVFPSSGRWTLRFTSCLATATVLAPTGGKLVWNGGTEQRYYVPWLAVTSSEEEEGARADASS